MATITSIIPATGWYAAYDMTFQKGEFFQDPLACWALLDDGTVQGMVADLDRGIVLAVTGREEMYQRGFTDYLHETEPLCQELLSEAKQAWDEVKE